MKILCQQICKNKVDRFHEKLNLPKPIREKNTKYKILIGVRKKFHSLLKAFLERKS